MSECIMRTNIELVWVDDEVVRHVCARCEWCVGESIPSSIACVVSVECGGVIPVSLCE